jgi:hypothetical protein
MISNKTICLLAFVASGLVVAGCGGQDGGAGNQASASSSSDGALVASVDKGNGHVIEFRRDLAGDMVVIETGPAAEAPLLADMSGKTASDLYRIAEPGAAVPQAIVEADAHAAEKLKEPVAKVATPADAGPAKGEGPVLYTAAQQAWFKSTFCVNNSESSTLEGCVQGYSFIHMPWNYGMQYQTQLWNGSEGQTGTVTLYNWNGSAAVTALTASLPPGYYWHGGWPVQSPQWHTGHLDNVGNSTLVSGADENCGEADEWSCLPNCGACDPEQSGACEIIGAAGQSYCENGDGE